MRKTLVLLFAFIITSGVLFAYTTYLEVQKTYGEILNINKNDLYINTYLVSGNTEYNYINKERNFSEFDKGITTETVFEHSENLILPYQGQLSFKTDSNIEISSVYVALSHNDNNLFKDFIIGDSLSQDFFKELESLGDSNYSLKITYGYIHKEVSGSLTHTIDFHLDMPAEVILSKTEVVLGDLIEVEIINKNDDEELIFDSELYGFDLKLYDSKTSRKVIGLIPIDYRNQLGKYCVMVNEDCYEIEIVDKDFREVHFNIPKSIYSSSTSSNAYAEYNTKVGSVMAAMQDDINFENNFVLPTTGRLTSDFLDTRYINGATKPSSYHKGIDIANAINTDIVATSSGVVILAEFLQVTGNTVIIYHGNNLYSYYLHCNELLVEADDYVKTGESIAYMGTTGLSTGSHLHFAFKVGNTYVDPWLFIDRW